VTGGRRSGFTLIEILIAVTIFGIISMAVYSTFRVGLTSYEAGRERMVVTQTGRVALDLLTRDLRSLYYLGPRLYNGNVIAQTLNRARERWLREQAGRTDGSSDKEKKEEKLLPAVPIDLTIIGEDHEDADALTFVTYQTNWGTAPVQPWALARVKYFVEGGNLFRAEGPITVDQLPGFQMWQMPALPATPQNLLNLQELAPEPPAPEDVEHYLPDAPREVVARGVKTFDFHYGYWTDEGWYETPDWIAHERRFRHPPYPYDPQSPFAQMIMQRNMARQTDDVPAYVVVTLALSHGKDGSRTQVFRTRIRLPISTETYEPLIDPGIGAGGPLPNPPSPMPMPLGPSLAPRKIPPRKI
jgi:prepilin-type N-terminal cleavage/methylation domain-containing protein